ncbi:hypothetical protein AB0H86_21750 [Streptomyces sp. NPDC050997]|uniref:hypothetical protein n=1 Tax=Streptomyces sp. NPDC050997 TaxID=3155519 RepID=UPI00343DF5FE
MSTLTPTDSQHSLAPQTWRNVRTHTLHDHVAHKRPEVGRRVLEGELPEPTRYF